MPPARSGRLVRREGGSGITNASQRDITIRPIEIGELDQWAVAVSAAFGGHRRPEEVEVERPLFEAGRTLGAFDGADMVAGAVAASFQLTVPGAIVPCAGVTGVGVMPTHRRRGILTALMRRQLDDIREGGEPLAALWASEATIYGRFGYGVATLVAGLEIERSRTAFVRPHVPAGTVRLLEKDAAMDAFASVYERFRPGQPGMIDRPPAWWRARFADHERFRDGFEELFFAGYERDSELAAYAVYHLKHDWSRGIPGSTLGVEELMASDPESYASIWRYVFDVDLVARIEAHTRAADEPLLILLAEPRCLNLTLRDGAWVRLVDVRRALAARRYPAEGTLTLDVADEFCPWNGGRYELDGGPEGATCRKGRRRPDVRLDSRELASVYLGGITFSQLARAGRIDASPEAVLKADAMFGWDRAPWCPHIF